MATQRQIESARINGVKSRGPKTPEGKHRSSMNARKHGLTAKTIATDPESAAALSAIVAGYMADLRPASPEEISLVYQLADSTIRQRQSWAAETAAWNRALAAHDGCLARAAEMLAKSSELACILRYETRFRRQYDRALKQFLAARDLRLRNEPDPSAPAETILPNEPDPSASNPPLHGTFAKGTGCIANNPRHRCSHRSFLQNKRAPQRRAPPAGESPTPGGVDMLDS